MSKHIQVTISEDAWSILDNMIKLCNTNFNKGRVSQSDIVSEALLVAKLNIKSLQNRSIDLKKFLKQTAAESQPDIDDTIKTLNEIKARLEHQKKTSIGKQEVLNDA